MASRMAADSRQQPSRAAISSSKSKKRPIRLNPSLPDLKNFVDFESYVTEDDLNPSTVLGHSKGSAKMTAPPSLSTTSSLPQQSAAVGPKESGSSKRSMALDILLGSRRSSQDRPPIFNDKGPVPRQVPGNLHLANDEHIKHMLKTRGSINLVRALAQDLAETITENTEIKERARDGFTGLAHLLQRLGVSDAVIEACFRKSAFGSSEKLGEDIVTKSLTQAIADGVQSDERSGPSFDISPAPKPLSSNRRGSYKLSKSRFQSGAKESAESNNSIQNSPLEIKLGLSPPNRDRTNTSHSLNLTHTATNPQSTGSRVRSSTVSEFKGKQPMSGGIGGTEHVDADSSVTKALDHSAHVRARSDTNLSDGSLSVASPASKAAADKGTLILPLHGAPGALLSSSPTFQDDNSPLHSSFGKEASGFPSAHLPKANSSLSRTSPEMKAFDQALNSPRPVPESKSAANRKTRFVSTRIEELTSRDGSLGGLELDFIFPDDSQPPALVPREGMVIDPRFVFDRWGFIYESQPNDDVRDTSESHTEGSTSADNSSASENTHSGGEATTTSQSSHHATSLITQGLIAKKEQSASKSNVSPTSGFQAQLSKISLDPFRKVFRQLHEVQLSLESTREQKWNDFIRRCSTNRSKAASRPEELLGIAEWGTQKEGTAMYAEYRNLLYKGIPVSLRPKIYKECCRASFEPEPGHYQRILKERSYEFTDSAEVLEQIRVDANRTLPDNIFFRQGPGIKRLQEVLTAYARFDHGIKYCQGMNYLAGFLILTTPTTEDAFWLLVYIIHYILPSSYFTDFTGAKADQYVLGQYVEHVLPKLHRHFLDHNVQLDELSLRWFLTMFSKDMPPDAVYRMWDIILCRHQGSCFILEGAIALLQLNQDKLLQCTSAAEINNHLSHDIFKDIMIDSLMQMSEVIRQKHIRPTDVAVLRAKAARMNKLLLYPDDAASDETDSSHLSTMQNQSKKGGKYKLGGRRAAGLAGRRSGLSQDIGSDSGKDDPFPGSHVIFQDSDSERSRRQADKADSENTDDDET